MFKLLPVIIFCLLAKPANANESNTLQSFMENGSCNECNLPRLNLGLHDLQMFNLKGKNLSNSFLVNVDLSNANLSNSDLRNT